MMNKLRQLIEWNVFGVCTYIGEKLHIPTSSIRKYFIYISFLTFGSPVVLYFFVAFWMNVRNYVLHGRRNPLRN
ncbi:MAG: PspC family transcriptional regulator [Chitinophagaceae bacterium]|mgnify:CR=1 FL=1